MRERILRSWKGVRHVLEAPGRRVGEARAAREQEERSAEQRAYERAAAARERGEALARLGQLRAEIRLMERRR